MHYVENALEVKSLTQIPKLNSFYKGLNGSFENYKVIAINTYENDDHKHYLFYKVYYQDTTVNKENYLCVNCCYFEYCIKKINL
jgi:hypothetical protein